MVRVKRGLMAHKRRKHLLSYTKGFKWGRKSKYRLAKEALLHAWSKVYYGRKLKKRDFRRLWQLQINIACRNLGLSYSQLMGKLKKANVQLDRKVLAELANKYPEIFKKVVEKFQG